MLKWIYYYLDLTPDNICTQRYPSSTQFISFPFPCNGWMNWLLNEFHFIDHDFCSVITSTYILHPLMLIDYQNLKTIQYSFRWRRRKSHKISILRHKGIFFPTPPLPIPHFYDAIEGLSSSSFRCSLSNCNLLQHPWPAPHAPF